MLTKAVKKVESMLPKSPRKREKVVKQLISMKDHNSPDSHAKEGRPPLGPKWSLNFMNAMIIQQCPLENEILLKLN